MSSVKEMRAAAIATALADLPRTRTASFDTAGPTMMGMLPEAFAAFARDLLTQPLAIGANCGVGAADLLVSILDIIGPESCTPVIAKANGGVPMVDGDRVVYSGTVETLELYAPLTMNAGPRIIGGGRRDGTLGDFRAIPKITRALGVLHWQGGVVTEPTDIPVPHCHLEIYLAHSQCSDVVWPARGVGGVLAAHAIAISAIEYDTTVDGLTAHPTLVSVTNVNSPRRVDEEILDNSMTMARHGQCVVIMPVTLMGAKAPVTLAQQTAEAMGSIAQVQMIRAGYPAAPGGFIYNIDIHTGSPAFGTPEYVHVTLGGVQIARPLKILIAAPPSAPPRQPIRTPRGRRAFHFERAS